MSRSQAHMKRMKRLPANGVGAPRRLTLPTKSGTATNGQTITGTNGTFRGKGAVITRQWVRQDAVTGRQTIIAGQTGATLVLGASDVGKKIRFQNTATIKRMSTKTQSTPTATVV
jgi:hypothetical protein